MALTHTERAGLRDRPARYGAIHELWIAGEDWSNALMSASVAWTAEGAGGSNLDFTVEGSLEGLQDAPVRFGIGYGRDDVRTYFRGRLQMPKDHEQLPQASGVAFGPFRLLTDAFMRNTMTYQGKNLEYVFMDLSRRAEYPPGDFLVLGGRNYDVPAGDIYSMGTSLQEVAAGIMEKAKYVAFDLPGGKRIVMPQPKPGSNGSIKAVLDPSQYKTFTTDPSHETSYYSVVVYRNEGSTWGGGPVYSERVIDAPTRFKPPKSRVYYVPDFPGSQSQAADEAMRLAMNLRDREKTFTITMPFNRTIALYDGFRVIRVKNRKDKKRIREVYICTIDKDIAVEYTPGSLQMTATGVCYQIRDERLEIDTRFEKRATSYGVVVPTIEDTTFAEDFVIPDSFTPIG
jgi:hypothetical protein